METDQFGFFNDDVEPEQREDDGLTDAEADAMTLANAGMGTDEDYGRFSDDNGY